ncbi:Histone acetyltransferase type B subunit 2 [Diplonema papillatum]|nr:Histone acetyltransferase type B subunit 2 [Diplonema papillatum]
MLAVGDSTGDVHVLDIRNAAQPLFTLSGHTKEVYSIDWSPHQPSVLASGGNDCNVLLWDLRGRDSECHLAYAGDKEAGHTPPPRELLFKHTGHSDEVGQVSWSFDPELRGTLASVDLDAEEPTVQVWRPRNNYWVDA